jgi:hypothetical protein
VFVVDDNFGPLGLRSAMSDTRAWLNAQLERITLQKLAAFLVGIAATIYIITVCVSDQLLALLALTGALTGWFAGILATPLSKKEGQRFNELAKVISGFVSGYLLSKVDPLVGSLFQLPASGRPMITDPYVAKQALVTLSSFFTALLFVVGGRLYWTNPNDVSVLDGPRGAAGKSLSTAPTRALTMINYRRGILRVSVVWIVTWLLVLAAAWWRVDRIGLDHFQSIALGWGILFPVLLFAVFVVGMWVLEGFRASASAELEKSNNTHTAGKLGK